MIITATSLVVGAGIALTSDDQLITAMVRPLNSPCGSWRHVVSDEMRHSRSIREALALGLITVEMDAADSSDFVAQVELNALAAFVSGLSGFSGSSGVAGQKTLSLDFHGAADNEDIDIQNDVPFLKFKSNKKSTSIWTLAVPEDYQAGTDVVVEIYWSPANTDTGSVKWLLEHKVIPSGSSVAGPSSTASLVQAAPGVASLMQTTGTALVVPAASVSVDAMLNLSVSRDGAAAADTFSGTAQVHLVVVRYTGLVFA